MNEKTAWYLGIGREKTAGGKETAGRKATEFLGDMWQMAGAGRKGQRTGTAMSGEALKSYGMPERAAYRAGQYAPHAAGAAGAAALGGGGYMAGQQSEQNKPWYQRLMGD